MYSTSLKYFEYGDAVDVVKKCKEPLAGLKDNEVQVKMLAAPINPADLLTIKGLYPSRPQLPAVPGNEGVGQVVGMGKMVDKFKLGDHVVPLTNMLGTWSSHINVPSDLLMVIPKNVSLLNAATFTVNPCTAYRLLMDFVTLEPGDVVIQNGGNSACGKFVIQLAHIWGYKTINIVRNRPDIDSLKACLKKYGATEVLTEEELKTTDIFSSKLPRPKLAIDCIGGPSAKEILKQLQHGGTMVTYGGMSGKPLEVDMSYLIFKDLRIRGYWMTEWNKRNFASAKRFEMFDKLFSYLKEGKLRGADSQAVFVDDYKDAFARVMKSPGVKFILTFEKDLF